MRFLARAFLGLLLLAVSLGLLGGAVWKVRDMIANRPPPREFPKRERVWQVETVKATPTKVDTKIQGFGSIVEGRSLVIRSDVAGRAININPQVQEGGLVEANSQLFQIDPFDSDSQLRDAELARQTETEKLLELETQIAGEKVTSSTNSEEIDLLKVQLDRQQQLFKRGIVSKAAVERARMALLGAERSNNANDNTSDILERRLDQQRIALSRSENNLERLKRDAGKASYLTPFAGVLQDVDLQEGQLVGSSDRLARLIDLTGLEVKFQLSNREAGQVIAGLDKSDSESDNKSLTPAAVVGAPINVTWNLGDIDIPFQALIDRLAPSVDASRGGLDLFATLVLDEDQSSKDLILRPGAFVSFEMSGGTLEDVIALPASAVTPSGMVFTVSDERRVARVSTQVVHRDGDTIFVANDGLKDALVVTRRFPQLDEGLKVRLEGEAPPQRGGGFGGPGAGGNRGGGKPNAGGGDPVLSDEGKKKLIAAVDASRMPDDRKAAVKENIDAGTLDPARLASMSERMGLDLKDLIEKPVEPKQGAPVLSDSGKTKLIAAVDASRMPDDRKAAVKERIANGTLDPERLTSMTERMGLDLKDLTEKKPASPKASRQTGPKKGAPVLSESGKAKLIAAVDASQMPDDRKAEVKERIANGTLEPRRLKQTVGLMGLNLKELTK